MTKKKFAAPTSGLEDVYFTWGMVIDAAKYTEVVDKLKEYTAVHFCNQPMVAARAVEELKTPVFTKTERLVGMYWSGTSQEEGASNETKKKSRNPGAEADNKPKLKDWEHKRAVDKYIEA